MSVTPLARRRPSESFASMPALEPLPVVPASAATQPDLEAPPTADAFTTPPQCRPALDGKHAAQVHGIAEADDPPAVHVHGSTPVWQGDARRTEAPSARRVYATLAPWHQQSTRRILIAFTPIAAMAAGIAGYVAYRRASLDAFIDPQTFTGHGNNHVEPVSAGVASLVGGALLPWAIARTVRGLGRCWEGVKECREAVSAKTKMNQLIDGAIEGAPLTQSGLDHCFKRLDVLARGHQLSAADHALGLARLATAAAKRGTCIRSDDASAFKQVDRVISALGILNDQGGLELRAMRSALLDVARRIKAETPISSRERALLADRLVDEFDRAVSRHAEAPARTQQVVDFKALLSGLPTMRSEQVLQQLTPEELHACGALDLALDLDLDALKSRPLPTLSPPRALEALRQAPPHEVPERAADAVMAALSDPPGAMDPTAPSTPHVLALAEISDALRVRTDLPAGALLGGVLDPDPAISLLRRVQWSDRTAAVDLTEAVFKVANLCQYRSTTALHDVARQSAIAIWDEDIRNNKDQNNLGKLLKAAQQRNAAQLLDARLSIHRGEGALGERLHLPWLS